MNHSTFLQEAKSAGFTDVQTVLLMDKFDEAEKAARGDLVTIDKLQAELGKLKFELYVAGVVALAPLYAKVFGVI